MDQEHRTTLQGPVSKPARPGARGWPLGTLATVIALVPACLVGEMGGWPDASDGDRGSDVEAGPGMATPDAGALPPDGVEAQDAPDAPSTDTSPSPEPVPEPPAPEPPPAEPPPPEPPPAEPCPFVRVVDTGGIALNVRPDPSRAQAPVGALPEGEVVERVREVQGEAIDGVSLWYEIRSPRVSGYVFSRYAACVAEGPPPPAAGDDGAYYVPFACGRQVRVSQGNGGATSHTGRAQYAFDFSVSANTPVVAMRAGRVSALSMATRPGDPCYGGGGSGCANAANWVVLEHDGGQTSAYVHLNSSTLRAGDVVARGQEVGLSGSTGWSTGPHLHLELRDGCANRAFCQTVPLRFADVGVPGSNATVTSGNCP